MVPCICGIASARASFRNFFCSYVIFCQSKWPFFAGQEPEEAAPNRPGMAWQMQVRLPKFKVTQRANRRTTIRTRVPRGSQKVSHVEAAVTTTSKEVAEVTDPPVSPTTSMPDGVCHDEQQIPSLHTIKQAANGEAWNNIRSDLLTLGAHAQRGLQYLVCHSVSLSVCLSVCYHVFSRYAQKSDTNGFSATLALF